MGVAGDRRSVSSAYYISVGNSSAWCFRGRGGNMGCTFRRTDSNEVMKAIGLKLSPCGTPTVALKGGLFSSLSCTLKVVPDNRV